MNRSKIKNSLLLAILFAFTIISCQKEDAQDSSEAVEDVTSFLKMSSDDDTTSPTGIRKHFRDITEVDIASLNDSIKNYIATNFPAATIVKAGVDSAGFHYVKIERADGEDFVLLFGPQGRFIKVLKKCHRNKHFHIEKSRLPIAIIRYIDSNYARVDIKKVFKDCHRGFKVIIELPDGTYLGLLFDEDGKFVMAVTVKDKHGKKKRRK